MLLIGDIYEPLPSYGLRCTALLSRFIKTGSAVQKLIKRNYFLCQNKETMLRREIWK
jgi:hypothetical protein